jgi:hypothetical protein
LGTLTLPPAGPVYVDAQAVIYYFAFRSVPGLPLVVLQDLLATP